MSVGHKGLFVERLDVGVADASVPGSRGWHHPSRTIRLCFESLMRNVTGPFHHAREVGRDGTMRVMPPAKIYGDSMALSKKFWSLSNAGNDDDSDTTRSAISTRFRTGFEFTDKCLDSKKITPPKQPLAYIEQKTRAQLEDVPWTIAGLVVSARVQALIRHLDPKAAQFIPVNLKRLDGTILKDDYVLVNWLRRIECVDLARSDMRGAHMVLSRVPKDVHFGRLNDDLDTQVASDEFRKAMKKAGYTGAQFYRVRQSVT